MMAQQAKALAVKPDHLGSITEIHMVEKENRVQ